MSPLTFKPNQLTGVMIIFLLDFNIGQTGNGFDLGWCITLV